MNEDEDENENQPFKGSLLSVNFVEVAMLGRACKQPLLSLKRNIVCCLLSVDPQPSTLNSQLSTLNPQPSKKTI